MVEVDQLSYEQQAVAQSEVSSKVQAYAGSGKSTTLIAYAQQHPKERILYLCFNRPNRIQFENKVKKLGLGHVAVGTAHGVARYQMYGNKQINLAGSLAPHHLERILSPILDNARDDDHTFLIYHAQKMVKSFCSSKDRSFPDFNYLNFVNYEQAKDVQKHYDIIYDLAGMIMEKMSLVEIPVLHDYYLKRFQLANISLNYDTILYDEVQDCSPCMIDIAQQQDSRQLYVGDVNQEIYTWRGAINAFQYIQLPQLKLSTSYRFGPGIARLAEKVIGWKSLLQGRDIVSEEIQGAGPSPGAAGQACIARTTVGILKEAIAYVKNNSGARIKFHGSLAGYIGHELGFSLYDVYSLFTEKPITNTQSFLYRKSFSELEEYATVTDDHQLRAYIKLCNTYPKQLPYLLSMLKKAEVQDGQGDSDAIVFSTAHRMKGVEYSTVNLSDDFLTLDALLKMKTEGARITPLLEEINLLYVALTRAAGELYIGNKYL